ncbi:hypothetical protein [Desulfonema magnum]|uniref:Clostridial hydrophobic repeat-containing protein n=1 Tax=Desulfonema magnum TaxID=45655 RepID=A0A975BTE7_9BACT|nr:hypothetical protein [Desulfonema magnum]QTA91351.1 Clostridial hydrophobic repeat-containing protein [Desulfonema magnum]
MRAKFTVIAILLSIVLLITMNTGVANAASVRYKSHVAEKGWLEWVRDGQVAGTTGESRQMEAVRIEVSGLPAGTVIKYRTHSANKGWLPWVSGGEISGTTGEARRIEAIQIKLLNSPDWNVKYKDGCPGRLTEKLQEQPEKADRSRQSELYWSEKIIIPNSQLTFKIRGLYMPKLVVF